MLTATGLPTLHHGRQQRQHPRGLGQPADPRRHCRRRRSPRPGSTRRSSPTRGTTAGATPTELVPGGNDINASVDQPVRRPQPDARLLLLPRLHRGELQPAARQPRPRRRRTATRRSATPRPARSAAASRPFLGRDNANQITLQDGIPGITNQYLFQPIAGAFYAPCTDGGLDMGIVGHEYTHAISNRMVGGPDEGLTSEQGGAMGESWGDLVAAEYQFAHGYTNGGNVWAVGAYATGNTRRRHPRLRHQQQPAELLRLRLRHHRPRGPRRRRDLERHAVGGPPGPGREVRRRSSPTPTRRCSSPAPTATATETPLRRRPSARATAAGCS